MVGEKVAIYMLFRKRWKSRFLGADHSNHSLVQEMIALYQFSYFLLLNYDSCLYL